VIWVAIGEVYVQSNAKGPAAYDRKRHACDLVRAKEDGNCVFSPRCTEFGRYWGIADIESRTNQSRFMSTRPSRPVEPQQ
jgi:hypothetical protein